jgi:hypothetical protein
MSVASWQVATPKEASPEHRRRRPRVGITALEGGSEEMGSKYVCRGLMLIGALVCVMSLGVLSGFSGHEAYAESAAPDSASQSLLMSDSTPPGLILDNRRLTAGETGPAEVRAAGATVVGYSVDSDVSDRLWKIDLRTGVATPIGPTGFEDIESLSFSADQVLYGVDQITGQLVTCDLTTGACSAVGPLAVSFSDTGLSFDDAGNLWMSTDSPGDLYSLDPTTGQATSVGIQGQKVSGLAFGSGKLYGLGNDNLVTLNTATGAATQVGLLVTVSLVDGGIDFDPGGGLWGIEDSGQIFTINRATGAATVVATVKEENGTPRTGFEGLAIWPVAEAGFVPEPGSILLLGSGLASLAGYVTLRLRASR